MEPGYTRLGHLKVDSTGTLRTITDYPLTDNITIDMTKYQRLEITREGKVLGLNSQNSYDELGQITLKNFINPAGLEAHEDTLFVATLESGDPISGNPGEPYFGELMQGYVERSNVDGSKELIKAVMAQRYGNANAALLRMAQDMEKVNISQISQI
jgi:flagellar basal-body rod protein FlgG